MSLVLRKKEDHLRVNRKDILVYALLSSAVGAVPLPVLDEWFASAARRKVVRKIAQARSVDVDKNAVEAIADGAVPPPAWSKILRAGVVVRLALKQWRKFLIAVVAAQKVQEASKIFCIMTCFDHYTAKHHLGVGLDGDKGKKLRETIVKAISNTPGGLSRNLFKKGLQATSLVVLRGPRNLVSRLTEMLDLKRNEMTDEDSVETFDDATFYNDIKGVESKEGLRKIAMDLEMQFSPIDNAYLANLLAEFDRLWSK